MTAEPIQLAEAAAQRKAFRRDGLGHVWDVADHDVQLRADYLSAKSEEVHAEIAVTRRGRHLHLARFNLSSSASRASLAKTLAGVTNGLEIPWPKLVENFCVSVLRTERQGEPTRYAQKADRRNLKYLVEPFIIEAKSNMLFAPGGSGKGMTCVGVSCAVAANLDSEINVQLAGLGVLGGRPFYFDWEEDFETFEDRLNAVAGGLGIDVPQIPYRRMRGLASDHINEMARAISDEGATFGIIDSFSAAGGTVSDHTGWDTIAHRLFDALDQVPGMTWLIIDHVTGDRLKDPSGKAYGSIQKMNRVRNAWEMRSEQEPGSPYVHMKFFHAKWNHTGRKKPVGILMEFSGQTGTVKFSAEDVAVDAEASSKPTTADRMANELAKGPLSTGVLANSLNVPPASIRVELNRNKDRFRRDGDFIVLTPPKDDSESDEYAEPEPLPF